MEYFLENDELIVRINSFGAEVKSVLSKSNYREYLWYGDSRYWGRTSPVLFPFVGSLRDKKYIYNGISYPMGQHGFARDMEFELTYQSREKISFTLKSNEETLKKYPLPFELIITYVLSGNELGVNWTVINPSKDDLYFSIGAHPAFLCPVHGENSKTGYSLYFGDKSCIHHHGNTSDTGLSIDDEDIVIPLKDGRVTITEDFFDRCTYMIEGNQTGIVGIEDSDNNRIVDVLFDTPLFAIWSPEGKNAPFICIEPWYGRADAKDFKGELKNRKYGNTLRSAEQFDGGYSMKFYKVN